MQALSLRLLWFSLLLRSTPLSGANPALNPDALQVAQNGEMGTDLNGTYLSEDIGFERVPAIRIVRFSGVNKVVLFHVHSIFA